MQHIQGQAKVFELINVLGRRLNDDDSKRHKYAMKRYLPFLVATLMRSTSRGNAPILLGGRRQKI